MIETTPPSQSSETVLAEAVRQARSAFLRDFPALLADRKTREKYICYHKDKLVAISKTYIGIIDEINRLDLPHNEWLMFKVTPGEDITERAIENEEEI